MGNTAELDPVTWRGPADPDLGGITILFPVYNESLVIERTVRSYFDEFQGRVPDFELIVAEDGSTDGTKAVLRRLEAQLPIRVYASESRKGYQEGILEGLRHAQKPWVFLVDSDYQFDPIDFWRLEPHRRTHDVILGRKLPRKDPFHRVLLSRVYNFLLRSLFHVPYLDMDTGFRLIRRSSLDEIAPQIRFLSFFTAEFVIRAHVKGNRIIELPVPHHAREDRAKRIFAVAGLPRICLQQLAGMVALRIRLGRDGLLSRRT